MTQRQEGPFSQSEPAGVASELFRVTRPWALGFSVLLFTYAAVGGSAGVLWLIALVDKLVAGPPPSRPFITVWNVNLLFAPIALVGGVLAISYYSAAGCAYWPDDLERASIALKRLRHWAVVAVGVLIAFLACMAVAAVLTGEFPG